MANFSITGDQETLKLFKEVTEVEVKKVLNKIGDVVVDKMQSDIAVDTANAQKSIKEWMAAGGLLYTLLLDTIIIKK